MLAYPSLFSRLLSDFTKSSRSLSGESRRLCRRVRRNASRFSHERLSADCALAKPVHNRMSTTLSEAALTNPVVPRMILHSSLRELNDGLAFPNRLNNQ